MGVIDRFRAWRLRRAKERMIRTLDPHLKLNERLGLQVGLSFARSPRDVRLITQGYMSNVALRRMGFDPHQAAINASEAMRELRKKARG